jgi:P27 family predicted phage terminase small subunit
MPRKGSASPKKATGTAIDSRNGMKVALRPKKLARFEPPAGLSDPTKRVWADYWDDPISELATPADRSLLLRWIEMVERYQLFLTLAMKEPEVRGSTGQKQVNGFFNSANQVEGRIAAIEQQLGIGPKNRAALGIAVLSEQKTLSDMNADFEDGGEDDDEDDPRIKIISGEAER